MGDHDERLDLKIAPLPNHDIILGKPWLEKWNPSINWRTNAITFSIGSRHITINAVTPQSTAPLALPTKKLEPTATLPERKTPLAAGYDLTPMSAFQLAPGQQQMIETGLAMAIPAGCYGQLAI